MKIFVFGNPDLAGDNIVFQILPKLRKKFPRIQFIHKDPLESWVLDSADPSGRRFDDRSMRDQKFKNKKIKVDNSKKCRISDDRHIYDIKEKHIKKDDKLIILDTVKGISKVTIFEDLKNFSAAHKRTTVHDFDLYDELALLQKLKKLPKIAIIGVSWGVKQKDVWDSLTAAIQSI